jgi:ribosomal protein S15P/S13E
MARLKQSQNTDRLIEAIRFVLKNRCSLSEEDVNLLTEAVAHLQKMRNKKGRTNKDRLETGVNVIELLIKFFK